MSGKLSSSNESATIRDAMSKTSSVAASGSKGDPDVILVTLVPEKKGLFLKHSEYEISSRNYKCSVARRYNDFVNLHNLLVTRFPYRMVPRLPPKQLMLDSLLEERRRGLQRWLKIVSRHPIIGSGSLLRNFLTDSSADHQEHLRELFNSEPDEFSTLSEEVELPLEDQGRLASNREIMRTMLNAVTRLKKFIDQQVARSSGKSKDMEDISSILKLLSSSDRVFTFDTFTDMTRGFHEVAKITEKSAVTLESAISERFNMLLDVLTAHSDLCDRVEKGIVAEHQRALTKMLTLNKQKMKGVIRGTAADNVAALHEKEVAQTGVVGTLGRRSAFSLQCVLQETSLAQEYLQALPSIILAFCNEQNLCNSRAAEIWKEILHAEAKRLNQ
ncbi:sorting nexin-8-like isoform X2 [Phlebotomus argentipes]|uniref:sorting nexin-8-like isoform X2 n=1 Tax=Phlebotomus argentipes TaxID=94469 RepID=UPI002892A873|nr:sorting nexin-8-like isoform X2 [Phlebotomus argentipes]